MDRQWTAISYNWSLGRTELTVFTGPPDHDPARKFFETSYPGEVILALLAGAYNHGKTYPLTIAPSWGYTSTPDEGYKTELGVVPKEK